MTYMRYLCRPRSFTRTTDNVAYFPNHSEWFALRDSLNYEVHETARKTIHASYNMFLTCRGQIEDRISETIVNTRVGENDLF